MFSLSGSSSNSCSSSILLVPVNETLHRIFFNLFYISHYCLCLLHTAVVTSTTHTTVVTTTPQHYPQQPTAVPGPSQPYQGAQYPPYQPMPVQPGYGTQDMPTTPYQGQQFMPGPPPTYQEASE